MPCHNSVNDLISVNEGNACRLCLILPHNYEPATL